MQKINLYFDTLYHKAYLIDFKQSSLLLLLHGSTVLEEHWLPHISFPLFLYVRFCNKNLFMGWSC